MSNLLMTVITSFVCMLCMPETLGKSLQEIDEVWDERVSRAKSIVTFSRVRREVGAHIIELDELPRRVL